jgi:hypothetical protein
MIETLAHISKRLGIVALAAALLGFFGTAYCEDVARTSPLRPVTTTGYVTAVEYKGQAHYVREIDAEICRISPPAMFSSALAGMILIAFYISVFRRFP